MPGADDAADAGRELTVDGVGATERASLPDKVFPLPANDGGFCSKADKLGRGLGSRLRLGELTGGEGSADDEEG